MPEKQAAAAVGQVKLMQFYEQEFDKYNIPIAQLLLSREDFEDRRRYLNVRNTLLTLLKIGVVPIINENDTVTVEEIQFGDNDSLSAIVASKVEAELMIILTDVEGLYTADPRQDKRAELIYEIEKITSEPMRSKIVEKLRSLGFKYITIDLQGFRSGSLNESLTDEEKDSAKQIISKE